MSRYFMSLLLNVISTKEKWKASLSIKLRSNGRSLFVLHHWVSLMLGVHRATTDAFIIRFVFEGRPVSRSRKVEN